MMMKLWQRCFGGFRWSWFLLLLLLSAQGYSAVPPWLSSACPLCAEPSDQSGVYILDRGEDALMARSWLASHAITSIDVQYFIWSTDNIGILASEALLRAAEGGVKVRVLVDDLLIDANDDVLLALATHPNVEIKIYNPQHSVGVSFMQRLWNILTGFRLVNQRMHDKTAIFDGAAGITGGRNMADEYFDFDHQYNFRDRDVLLFGPVVKQMSAGFELFWNDDLAVPVSSLLAEKLTELTPRHVDQLRQQLHDYAANPDNFAVEVRRLLSQLPGYFSQLSEEIIWDEVQFVNDSPGKNNGLSALSGGGKTTDRLIEVLASARHSVLIQSPYLVLSEEGMELFTELLERGVRVRISTNSMASTDNLMAFSGYYKQRQRLLEMGVEIFEFKPDADIRQQLNVRTSNSVFAIHAKSMLVDNDKLYIGTFNLDPRSANLNTEVGVLVVNPVLGNQLKQSIEADMRPENSWSVSLTDNPDDQVGFLKRVKVWLISCLPLDAIL